MVKEMPTCLRCQAKKNWIDLGVILDHDDEGEMFNEQHQIHYYQCGGMLPHDDPENAKNGCGRIIRATPEEMSHGGVI